MKKKMMIGLAILVVAMVTPILCINLLGSGTIQQDNEITKEQEFEGFGIALFCPTSDDIRDPEFAKEEGILGYVELAWMDALPEELTLRPNGEWVGTMLIHFVSHVPEIADVEVQVDPNGEYGLDKSKVYRDEDGIQRVLDYSDLMSYEPSGILQLEAGQTLYVTVTIKIPADFPMSISSFRLSPLGIQPLHSQIALLTGDFEGRIRVIGEMRPDGVIVSLEPEDIRNRETAIQHGIRGYVELTWAGDFPQQQILCRGQEWIGTMLVHFVSYSSELSELGLYMEPSGARGGMTVGKYYSREDGTKAFFEFSTLVSYDPNGLVKIKAGETLPVTVTFQIPRDLPKDIETVPLCFMGISPGEEGVSILDNSGLEEVLVI